MSVETKNAERVHKPRLPKKRLLKKRKSKPSRAFDGAEKTKPTPKKWHVKFCPRCGSTNVFWASGLPQLWSIWECRDCGYRGPLILEDGKLAEKIRRDYQRKHAKG